MRNQKLLRLITLGVVVSLANICIAAAPIGILNSTNSKSVLVNGNLADEGMTILSSSELKTENSGAKVNIGGLGEVELGLNTTANVTYAKERIELNVLRGQASLTAYKGITGVLNTPEGKSLQTDSAQLVSTVDSAEQPAAPGNKKPFKDWTPGQKAGLAAAIGAAIVITIIIIVNRNNNRGTVSGVR